MPQWLNRIFESPIGRRMAMGAFWNLLGTLLLRISGVLSLVLVARIIGKVGMGEFGIIQSTVGIFSALAGMGMGLTATKFVAEHRHTDKRLASSMLGLSGFVTWISGTVMTLVVYCVAPWFANHTLAAPHLSGLIQIASILLLLGSINGAQTGALAGFEAFKAIARVNLTASIINFPLMIFGAYSYGLTGTVFGLIGSQLSGCVLSHVSLRKVAKGEGIRLWAPLQARQWSVLWRFSLPSVLCNMIFGPVGWACNAMLVNREHGYAEMGIYNVTLSWFNVVSFIPNVIGQVLLPILVSRNIESDNSNHAITSLAIKANALAVTPIVVIVAIFSPYIMSLYGHEFQSGWPTLIATVCTAAILAIQSPMVQSLTASGRMWLIFGAYVFYSASFLILTSQLVFLGSLGLSSARLVTYVANGFLVFWMATKLCKKRPQLNN